MTPDVIISEVGTRDGLQSVKAVMPTPAKLAWIDALAAAGLREIEVASFVPPRLMPQLADSAEVVRHAACLPGLVVLALVPNLKGAQAAIAAGAHKLTMPISASEAHSLANVRKTPAAMVEELREVVRLRRFSSPMRQGLDLLQEQPGLVGDALLPYFRDVTEHAIRVSELADNIRDLLTSLLELRVAQVANHLNVIMRKLTAWAGIVLVPTLIAGIYGMNFKFMPELGWKYGYPVVWLIAILISLGLYRAFRRSGWL